MGMWNTLYNSLPNVKFTSSTKIIAFADDLLLLTRGETVSEIENIANLELTNNSNCGKENKFRFYEKNLKAILMTLREKERNRGNGSLPKQQIPPTSKNHEILGYNNRKKIKIQRS